MPPPPSSFCRAFGAAPIVVGVVAQYLELHPEATPSQIKRALQETGSQHAVTGAGPATRTTTLVYTNLTEPEPVVAAGGGGDTAASSGGGGSSGLSTGAVVGIVILGVACECDGVVGWVGRDAVQLHRGRCGIWPAAGANLRRQAHASARHALPRRSLLSSNPIALAPPHVSSFGHCRCRSGGSGSVCGANAEEEEAEQLQPAQAPGAHRHLLAGGCGRLLVLGGVAGGASGGCWWFLLGLPVVSGAGGGSGGLSCWRSREAVVAGAGFAGMGQGGIASSRLLLDAQGAVHVSRRLAMGSAACLLQPPFCLLCCPALTALPTTAPLQIDASDVEVCRRPDGSPWLLGEGRYGRVYKALKGGVQVRAAGSLG